MALRRDAIRSAICGALLALSAPLAATGQPLLLERRIALPDVAGRIDHLAIDLGRGRLFVAELGNGSVDAIELASGRVVHRIEGLREPQGVAYAARADAVVVACGGDGTVRFFRADALQPAGILALGEDADNVRVNPGDGSVVVGYGGGALALIDPERRLLTGRIVLAAHPEGFSLAPSGEQAFVNVPDAEQIAVLDLGANRQSGSWRVPGRHDNFPIATDPEGSTVASVFRSPPTLVLLDARTGALKAQAPTCGDADDLFPDAKRHRLYVSCGAGAVDVFQRDASGLRPLARIASSFGARTSLFVPELDRLFVAARAHPLGAEAAILVFRPGD
jgi:DNA-binding beta-propeller fold protein YncE